MTSQITMKKAVIFSKRRMILKVRVSLYNILTDQVFKERRMLIGLWLWFDPTDSEHVGNTSGSCSSRSSSSNGGTISDGEGNEDHRSSRIRQGSMENYWDMSPEQEKYYTEQFLTLQPDLVGLVCKILNVPIMTPNRDYK